MNIATHKVVASVRQSGSIGCFLYRTFEVKTREECANVDVESIRHIAANGFEVNHISDTKLVSVDEQNDD